jgi:heavy metal translocating P-type ATPase
LLDWFQNDSWRTRLLLAISLAALAVSFFDRGELPLNAAWVAVVLCGIPILKGAVSGLVTAFDIKADVLVSLALIASVVIGETFAAGEIAFIMTVGAYLEERTVAQARAGIEKLVRLTPTTARVVRDGEETMVPAAQVKRGDTLRVLAGESIAVDGKIISGQSSIDQSVMTGESLPVDKAEGDEVFSGTVNQFGTFDMIAQKVGEDSSIQRMIRLVESADAGKAKIVGLADRWATGIVVIALLAAGLTWLTTGEIIRSVTILVVFCPCALVLATPTAIMAGIGNAAQYGILIREGDALERLAQVRRMAFDKTGTLTVGRPTVVAVESCCADLSAEKLLQIAASAELRSEHPLGKAIVAYAQAKNGAPPPEPSAFQMLAGRGVCAEIGCEKIYAGNEALLATNHITIPDPIARQAEKIKNEGCTLIYLAAEHDLIGLIALADTLRPNAAGTIQAIHKAGIKTLLLTGDTPPAAEHVARKLGIAEVKSSCRPEDKMAAILDYRQNQELICMVGDGVNDAPALKTAAVGIAMGGIGSDIAIAAADIALVGDDIGNIPHLLLLARQTMRTIKINLASSMTLNFIAIALAITGILNPVSGALVHNIGSVAVIINSSLLLNFKPTR